MKSIKKIIIFPVLTAVIFIAIYIFGHSTPERSIRTYLFSKGYLIKAFQTEIYVSNKAPWRGKYYCKNPGIGPDFIAVEKSSFGLWHVDLINSGGA